jgi:hypothetical protein
LHDRASVDDDRDTEPMEIPVLQEPEEMWLDVGDRRVTRASTSSDWPPEPQPPARPTERRARIHDVVARPPTCS